MKARPPILRAYFGADEIHVDLFAGGGGAGEGVSRAAGRSADAAINHSPTALAMYAKNHPDTRCYVENVFKVDPRRVAQGRRVALLWMSPDCTQFSKAKGGKPVDRKIRCLAWSALPWIVHARPRVIILENVEEFRDYGPLHRSGPNLGRPIAARKGETFRAFVRKLESKGYVVEHKILRACDYGAPTSRKRLFLIARCDGKPIRWPTPSHGPLMAPYRTAAECIDWSIPCPSIFDRKKPLSPKTEARIARGIKKFVLDAARPFVIPAGGSFIMPNNTNNVPRGIDEPVPTITTGNRNFLIAPTVVKAKTHGGGGNDAMAADEPLRTVTSSKRGEFAIATATIVRTAHGDVDAKGKRRGQGAHDIETPLGTICASGTDFAIAVPYLVHRSNGERIGQAPRIYDIERPLGTIVGMGQKHAVCAAFLAKGYSERPTGGFAGGAPVDKPIGTLTQRDHHSADAVHMLKFQQNSTGSALDEPLHTVMAGATRHALVASFLTRYNGTSGPQSLESPLSTIDTTDRFGLVTVQIDGETYVIVDIGMRMLTPRELYRAQGFDDSYEIDPIGPSGKPLTKTEQIRLCGNSVPPPFAEALAAAQFPEAA